MTIGRRVLHYTNISSIMEFKGPSAKKFKKARNRSRKREGRT
jgi:hypothetical protein